MSDGYIVWWANLSKIYLVKKTTKKGVGVFKLQVDEIWAGVGLEKEERKVLMFDIYLLSYSAVYKPEEQRFEIKHVGFLSIYQGHNMTLKLLCPNCQL